MKLRKYGIIGFPLEHSFSPAIHNRAFAECNIPGRYEKIEIPPERFESVISDLKKENWAGFNVTIPYKTDILPFLDELDVRAEQIGAVNTILVSKKGKWIGFNTDYIGFLRPLIEFKESLKKCLVLGAGGAARAVSIGIASGLTVRELTIANRTLKKAQELTERLLSFQTLKATACQIEAIPAEKFDLIVNTTSVGMGRQENDSVLDVRLFAHPKTIVYDLIYNPAETLFLKKARQGGLVTINGLPMLVYQAEEAFKIWTGKGFTKELMDFFLEKGK